MNSKIINCNTYDYVEIACMHKLLLRIKVSDDAGCNTFIEGYAQTTKIIADHSKNKHEYLVLKTTPASKILESGDKLVDDSPEEALHSIKLTNIISITALNDNRYFNKVDFISGTKT